MFFFLNSDASWAWCVCGGGRRPGLSETPSVGASPRQLSFHPSAFDVTTPECKISLRRKRVFFFFLLHIFLRVGQFLLSSLSWPGSCDQARCRSVFPAPGKRRHKEEAKVTAHQLELVLFSRTMAADRFIQIHSSLRFHFWPPFTLR